MPRAKGAGEVQQHELNLEVARRTGVKLTVVRTVTAAFVEALKRALIEKGSATVRNLGRFRLVTERRISDSDRNMPAHITAEKLRCRVFFAKGLPFKKQIHSFLKEGMAMDKYGVDEGIEQEKMEKAASEGCPECGRELVKHGSILLCPTHGSEPFEKKKK